MHHIIWYVLSDSLPTHAQLIHSIDRSNLFRGPLPASHPPAHTSTSSLYSCLEKETHTNTRCYLVVEALPWSITMYIYILLHNAARNIPPRLPKSNTGCNTQMNTGMYVAFILYTHASHLPTAPPPQPRTQDCFLFCLARFVATLIPRAGRKETDMIVLQHFFDDIRLLCRTIWVNKQKKSRKKYTFFTTKQQRCV